MRFHTYFQIIIHLMSICNSFGLYLDNENTPPEKDSFCQCMDYWQCFATGGQLYSYCSFSNEVCCMTDGKNSTEKRSIQSKSAHCGAKEFDSGLDEFAEPGEWSWHAALMIPTDDIYICGGSLIDEKWILTAAHCLDNSKTKSLKVRIGEYDVLNTNEPDRHQEIEVERIYIHSDFDSQTLANDIALISLKNSVQKRPNTNIVCLPSSSIFKDDMILGLKCYITGWGRVREGGAYSSVLKEVSIPLWDHNRCQQSLRSHFGLNYTLSKSVICGGDVGHDACDGDGGGGLYCQYKQRYYQVGIVSFGVGCGRQNSPGVYTNVLPYIKWIEEITSLVSK